MDDPLRTILNCLARDPLALTDDRLCWGQAEHPRRTDRKFRRPRYVEYTRVRHLMPEICCVRNGPVGFMLNNRFYRFHSGDVVLIPPMVPHFETCLDRATPYELVFIGFSSLTRVWVALIVYAAGQYRRILALHVNISSPWFHSLFSHTDAAGLAGLSGIRPALKEFFGHLHETIGAGTYYSHRITGPRKWRQKALQTAREYIEAQVTEKLTLKQIAARAGLNPSYLSAAFRAEYGDTVVEYLTWQKLNRAADLLEAPDLTVSQVAHQLNYSDIYYFSKLFKKTFGLSPKEYRDRYLS